MKPITAPANALEELSATYNVTRRVVEDRTPTTTPSTEALVKAVGVFTCYSSTSHYLALQLWELEESVREVQEECDTMGTNGAHQLKLYTLELSRKLDALLTPLNGAYLQKVLAFFKAYHGGAIGFTFPSPEFTLYKNLLLKPSPGGYRELHSSLLRLTTIRQASLFAADVREALNAAVAALEVQYLLSGYGKPYESKDVLS